MGIFLALMLIWIASGISNPNFFSVYNITNIVFQASFTYIVALAMTFVDQPDRLLLRSDAGYRYFFVFPRTK